MDRSVARLAVHGADGRMGRQLVAAIAERDDARLVGALEAPSSDALGRDAGRVAGIAEQGVPIGDALAADAAADVVIDFSTPAASIALLDALGEHDAALVLGTTGFDADQRRRLESFAAERPVVYAANYSAGVTLMLALVEQAARALGEDYDAEVIEAHHRHKVDAPSGTALAVGQALASGRGTALEPVAVYAREGITGAREKGTIGFATVRGGDVVGEHTALFAGIGERLEITHRATDRMTFARGAVRAALWLRGRGPGLYDMRDVLGLGGGDERLTTG